MGYISPAPPAPGHLEHILYSAELVMLLIIIPPIKDKNKTKQEKLQMYRHPQPFTPRRATFLF